MPSIALWRLCGASVCAVSSFLCPGLSAPLYGLLSAFFTLGSLLLTVNSNGNSNSNGYGNCYSNEAAALAVRFFYCVVFLPPVSPGLFQSGASGWRWLLPFLTVRLLLYTAEFQERAYRLSGFYRLIFLFFPTVDYMIFLRFPCL